METVRIGVIVKDRAYRNALLRGLSHESRDFQFVSIDEDHIGASMVAEHGSGCATTGDLCGRLTSEQSSNDIDSCQIVLADSELCDRLAGRIPEKVTLISLTYHEMYDMGYTRNDMEIFRYEDARVFIGKIIYYYSRKNGIDLYFHGKRKCRKVVFSSPSGGSGTTSAAMTSARFLKYRFGKKTLFISLCPLDGSRRFTGADDGGNILSLLYHLSAGDDVPLCKFISSSEGVDHFRGQSNNRAVAEMTITELKRLIHMIDDMGEYSYVLFDCGNHVGSLAQFLLDRADVCVVVRQKKGFDASDFLPVCEHGSETGKIIRVTDFDETGEEENNVEVKESTDFVNEADTGDVSVTYDPKAFVSEEKRTYIDIRGRYGRDVSRLAEKIIGCADEWG